MKNKSCLLIFSLLLLAAMSAMSCKQKKGGPPPGMKIPVVVAEAKVETILKKIDAVGDVVGDESVELRSEIDGRVLKIKFREGEVIEKNTPLVLVDQSKIKANLQEARANFNLARANRKRNQELLKSSTISQKEFDQAQAQYLSTKATLTRIEQNLGDSEIRAPFRGVMGTRLVSPGQWLQKGQVVSSIVSLDHIKVEFSVPERYIAEIQEGQKVIARVAAYPKREFRGELFYVSPEVDAQTRTILLKARIPNPKLELRAGMLADVTCVLGKREGSIVIPETAVVLSKDSTVVFVPDKESKIEVRVIKIGAQLAGRVEVLSGLSPGELVVSEGVQKVRPGAPVAFSEPKKETSKL